MNFGDIFKKSFLEAISTGDISWKWILFITLITCLFAAYIFFAYRIITRKTFYNKSFNISLAAIAIIVAAIVISIQSSLVVSLGMVGALSIVRFRTAIKDPVDLVFLFWSISIGIICGANLPGIALIESVVLTVVVIVLNRIPVAKAPMILIVNANEKGVREKIMEAVAANTKYYTVKSQSAEGTQLNVVIELRTKDSNGLVDNISKISGVTRCSLLNHDGEVTF